MKKYLILAGVAIAPMMLAASAIVAPAFAVTYISNEIGVGSTGADVSTLQTFLATNSTIYPQGLVTGTFGPLTEAAVVNWQMPTTSVQPDMLARSPSLQLISFRRGCFSCN